MSTNQFRQYLDLLNEADVMSNPYANDPKQAAIYASLSPEDQEWATRNGGRPDLTDPYIANRAPNKFKPVAPAAQSNSRTFGNTEPDLVPPNTDVALPSANTFSNDDAVAAALAQQNLDTRCAVCGTPQNQHQNLKHKFVPGSNIPPEPVPQGDTTGGGGDVGRIKQLQRELKQAGADLGQTGAGRDGIDGDLGPLTRAAMAKYPDIAAKYTDLNRAAAPAQAATPVVDTSKLDAALTAIESIIAKYKGKSKVPESRIYEANRPLSAKEYMARINQTIPPDPVAQETPGFLQSKIKTGGFVPPVPPAPTSPANPNVQRPGGSREAQAFRAQQAASASAKPKSWAASAGQKILSKLPGLGARTAARAGATAVSGPLAPLFFLGSAVNTVWDVGNFLYDIYKDSKNLEGMNDADQAVIKQNLAVVNGFMKDPKIADTLSPDTQARVEKVMTGLKALAVDTKHTTPVAYPTQAPTPAVQPTTPAANTVVPKLNVTLDKLDKLLKKNNFESVKFNTLSESEQLARYRDIVNEGPVSWAAKNIIAPAAKSAWDNVIKPSGNAIVRGTINNVIAPAAKLATLGTVGAGLYKSWEFMTAPKTMSAIDQAEFEKIRAEFRQLVPSQAAFDALPPDVKEKWTQVWQRAIQAGLAQGNQ